MTNGIDTELDEPTSRNAHGAVQNGSVDLVTFARQLFDEGSEEPWSAYNTRAGKIIANSAGSIRSSSTTSSTRATNGSNKSLKEI
jgi:hypothetical protein